MGETPSSAALVGRDAIDNVVLMEDHDRAYHAWKQARLSGRILLHIDAHIDWAWIGDKDPRVLLEARTSRQVESMLDRGLQSIQVRNRLFQPAKSLAQLGVDCLEARDIGVFVRRLTRSLVLRAELVEQRRSIRHLRSPGIYESRRSACRHVDRWLEAKIPRAARVTSVVERQQLGACFAGSKM